MVLVFQRLCYSCGVRFLFNTYICIWSPLATRSLWAFFDIFDVMVLHRLFANFQLSGAFQLGWAYLKIIVMTHAFWGPGEMYTKLSYLSSRMEVWYSIKHTSLPQFIALQPGRKGISSYECRLTSSRI